MDQIEPKSYWQLGCNDGRAGKEPKPPFPLHSGYEQTRANDGYMNGWKHARTAHYEPVHDEGSQP